MKKILSLDSVFICLIFGYFLLLLSFISPARHVDPDFFQFLRDSEYYLQLKLPPMIQSLPMNPILIGILSKIVHGYKTEIEVALFINAVSISGGILGVYLILRKLTHPAVAGLTAVYLMTNPIVFASATTTNTEALFSLFCIIVFILIERKRVYLVSILSALGILVRYESVLLFGALFIFNLFYERNLSMMLKYSVLFLSIALPILFILFSQNAYGSISQTPFLVEVFQRKEDIPEFRFFSHFLFSLYNFKFLLLSPRSIFFDILGLFFWSASFILLVKKNKKQTPLMLTTLVFSFLYLLFHSLFPAYLERYFVPGIFSFILFLVLSPRLISKKFAIIIIFLLSFIILDNFYRIASGILNYPNQFSSGPDYFTAQSIIDHADFRKKYVIVSPYPETLVYYYKKMPNIKIISVEEIKRSTNCKDITCAIENYSVENNQEKIIIPYNNLFSWGMSGNYDEALRKWYVMIGLFELGHYLKSDKTCLWYEQNWQKQFLNLRVYAPCLTVERE